MSNQTQELAPKSSIREFFAELEEINKESERSRPSRFNLPRFSDWRLEREKKIAEVARKYAEFDLRTPSSNNGHSLVNIDSTMLEEAKGHLIKATCMLEKESKKRFRHDFDRIYRCEKNRGHLTLAFVLKTNECFRFSEGYPMWDTYLSIFIDVGQGKNCWFMGKWVDGENHMAGIDMFELHVHSENEVRLLLEP